MGMTDTLQTQLSDRFGERVSFDEVERLLYAHDNAALPEPIKALIETYPDAVVQPTSVRELVALVQLANEYRVPLVPRGAGTSGVGGAVPANGGLIVDFKRMNRIVAIDPEAMTVTVEPGIVWWHLERELNKAGLSLRLYPTSALSSTVGGWVAQGGVGVGSFEYGHIGDNVVEVQIVTPQGEAGRGDAALDLVNECEGITGFISRVTLRVRENEEMEPVLALFPTAGHLSAALLEVRDQGLPLWSVTFATPQFVRLTQEATGERLLPEDKYWGLFAYPASREARVREPLLTIVEAAGGAVADGELAEHVWQERFYPLRLKSLGPSLVPSEVIIPVEEMEAVVADAVARLGDKVALEGSMAGRNRCSLRSYALADERSLTYPVTFGQSLYFIDIARKHGGELYSVGMYFTDEAESFFGRDRFRRLVAYKGQSDPAGIMNPGKIIPPSLDQRSPIKKLNAAVKVGRKGSFATGLFGKLVGERRGRRVQMDARISTGTTWDAFACSQCGYCSICPVYMAFPWESSTPRGQFYFLKEYLKGNTQFNDRMAYAFGACTSCATCTYVCQNNLPIHDRWGEMKGLAVQAQDSAGGVLGFGFRPPLSLLMIKKNLRNTGNIFGEPEAGRTAWLPEGITFKEEGEFAYFAGCGPLYQSPNTSENVARILDRAGMEFVFLGPDEHCCAAPMLSSGQLDMAEELIRHNVQELRQRGVKTLMHACATCWYVFEKKYPQWTQELGLPWEMENLHIVQVVHGLLRQGSIEFTTPVEARVTWHDPCHIGREGGIYDPPREVLRAIPGLELVEMEHHRENGLCCSTPPLRMRHPEWSDTIAGARVGEAEQAKAEIMTTGCTPCEFMFHIGADNAGLDLRVNNITDLVVEAMGMEAHEEQADQIMLSRWNMMKGMMAMMEEMPESFSFLTG